LPLGRKLLNKIIQTMSYRNPQIVRDTSGQVYGQAVANIGQSLAKGIATLGARREQQRKKAEQEAQRTQQIGYGIQTKAYEQRNKVYSELLKKEPGLAEQFKQQTEILLMGNDEVGMGAIEARTLLATGKDLSIKEKQDLQNTINRYEVFQNGLQGNAGKILSETQLYNNTSPADFDNKYRWTGSNQYERTASQFAAAALSDQEIPGARYEKKLYTPTKDGEQVVGIKVFVNPNDPANKGKFDDEEMYPRNENGEIEIEWKKDLNKWDEGLLEEIVASPDSNALFKNAGITNDKNQWSENQFLSAKGKSITIKGANGQDITTISRDINASGWSTNKVLQDEVMAKAEGYQGMRDDELSAFMEVKMKVGGFDIVEFRKLSTSEQQAEIAKELNEDFIIQKTKGLSKREANAGEPGAVIDPLQPTKEVDGKEVDNYVIYSQDSSRVTATPTPPDVDTTPQPYETFTYNVLQMMKGPSEGESGVMRYNLDNAINTDMAQQIMKSEGLITFTYDEAVADLKNKDASAAKTFENDPNRYSLYYKDDKGVIKPMVAYDGTGRGLLKAYSKTLPAGQLTQFNKAFEKANSLYSKQQSNKNKNKGASRFNTQG
jgi:hypothetical protein